MYLRSVVHSVLMEFRRNIVAADGQSSAMIGREVCHLSVKFFPLWVLEREKDPED